MSKENKDTKDRTTAMPKIMPCACTHEYQDKRYGKGMRVHNPNKSGYKCTVCGRKE